MTGVQSVAWRFEGERKGERGPVGQELGIPRSAVRSPLRAVLRRADGTERQAD